MDKIVKPRAVKVNVDNIIEVGKWFKELTGKDESAAEKIKKFKDMFGKYEWIKENIYLVESFNDGIGYNTEETMKKPEVWDKFEVVEYELVQKEKKDKKEGKVGIRFEKEGFEYRGWKLGDKVSLDGDAHKIIGFDTREDEDVFLIIDRNTWVFSHLNNFKGHNSGRFVALEGVSGGAFVSPDTLDKNIDPKAPEENDTPIKIYSLAALNGKVSACGNFFIEASETLAKVWTKTKNRDQVGVFTFGLASTANTVEDLVNFGFEHYELVEFDLTEITKRKLSGFPDNAKCRVNVNDGIRFIKISYDNRKAYDTIALLPEDRIARTTIFRIKEVK